jgi:uncharacterized protein
VLYEHLGLAELPASAPVVIVSALWGALRPADPVPPYKLAMNVKLPPLGGLAAVWRSGMQEVFGRGEELVVDLRSSAYAAAWNPGERGVAVRALTERGGHRSVISHMAKAIRGRVAGDLLTSGAAPRTPTDLAEALRDLGWTAELHKPSRRGRPWTLDVITTEPA